jgi:hypothetical protein
MSKRLAILINSLVAVVSGGAVALVTYFEPTNAAIINSAIDVASGAIITIVNLFVAPAIMKKLTKKDKAE